MSKNDCMARSGLTITQVSLLTPFPPFSFKNSNHHWVYSSFHPSPASISTSSPPVEVVCVSAPPRKPWGIKVDQKAWAVSVAVEMSNAHIISDKPAGRTKTSLALSSCKIKCMIIDFLEISRVGAKFDSQSPYGPLHWCYRITTSTWSDFKDTDLSRIWHTQEPSILHSTLCDSILPSLVISIRTR